MKKFKREVGVHYELGLLATFLNFDFRSQPIKAIRAEFTDRFIAVKFPSDQVVRGLQRKMKRELISIISPETLPTHKETEKRLRSLIRRINKISFNPTWTVTSVDEDEREWAWVSERYTEAEIKKIQKHQPPVPPDFNILGERWAVFQEFKTEERLHDYFWWVVINSMATGAIAKLKVCPECRVFFVQQDVRQTFCTEGCRYKYYNSIRQAEGYFIKKRLQTRARKLARAQSLLQAGKSPDEVSTRTKLSQRILRREGFIN